MTGLLKHRPSRKDYSFSKTFGATPILDLPDEYLLLSTVLNQGNTSKCTAYSSCAVAESKYGKAFDPDQFFYDEGVIFGKQQPQGYDIRIAMDTARKMGYTELGGTARTKEDQYFNIYSPFSRLSLADQIRSAMWMARDEKRCAELGLMWYQEFFAAPRGIIEPGYKIPDTLHAVKCAGWTYRDTNGALLSPDKKIYLVIQNSWGTEYGDQGLYYFPLDLASTLFHEGHYLWRSNQEEVQTEGLILQLLKQVVLLYKRLIQ